MCGRAKTSHTGPLQITISDILQSQTLATATLVSGINFTTILEHISSPQASSDVLINSDLLHFHDIRLIPQTSLSPGTNNLRYVKKKSTLELPKLWLFAVCLHRNTIDPLQPLKLQRFFTFFFLIVGTKPQTFCCGPSTLLLTSTLI